MRLAVASPFVDRRHGTERALAELLERLAGKFACEIHLYAQRVEDLRVTPWGEASQEDTGAIFWRSVPRLPGPHIFRFASWYLLNRWRRLRDRFFRQTRCDAVFSPGINCSDADLILVHAVFHRLTELQQLSRERGLRSFHRRLYYRMICALERRIYANPRVALAAVSRRTAAHLKRYFGRDDVTVIPNGVDTECFSPAALLPLRDSARQRWNFAPYEKVILLIGNDWRNKGLHTLLEAAALCDDLAIRLLIVGEDEPAPFVLRARQLGLTSRAHFVPPSPEVRTFYAAADILAAPSLEDSFNLPALEAMACGLPVILSLNAGISEWASPGVDCLLLRDAQDAQELVGAIRSLAAHPDLMQRLGHKAVQTAAALSWDRHAEAVFERLRRLKTNSL